MTYWFFSFWVIRQKSIYPADIILPIDTPYPPLEKVRNYLLGIYNADRISFFEFKPVNKEMYEESKNKKI